MADILYDTRTINQNCPKVIILTHADADGLVAALVVKAFEELEARKSVLIMSCMDVSNETTEKLWPISVTTTTSVHEISYIS